MQTFSTVQDEYDDTYDDVAVGQEEPDSREDEGAAGRKFVLPVALGGGKITRGGPAAKNKDGESEEDEEDDEAAAGRKKMDFVRNPEEVRQEAERRR